jgi:3-oxoacyl-[acyl-carrier protein] reductase
VNAVAPGFIATEMVAKMPDKVVSAMSEKVPLRRLGLPEDVAEAYLYLASDAANYVNGTVLEVNGGLNI